MYEKQEGKLQNRSLKENTMDRFYNSQLAIPEIKAKVEDLAQLPLKATRGSAGHDLFANEGITLHVGEIFKVSTGVSLAIPEGFEGQVRSRSGLASKGVIVVNSPGTIDSDYRGEIKVLLMSLKSTYEIKKGDRIAQLVFAPVVHVDVLRVVDSLDETERGEGGFGSTGSQSFDYENLVEARERRLLESDAEQLWLRVCYELDIERAGEYSEDECTEKREP